jgi:sRNA-binding carbon storage regulator CsrA
MLVLARRRNESLVIDGAIRVEVLRLAGGVARLRFTTPQSVPVMRGVAKAGDPSAVEAINGGIDASGMGIVDLTLGVQQVVTVGEDIHVGLVDVSAARVLLFVDAEHDVAVDSGAGAKGRSKAGHSGKGEGSEQGLLPFPVSFGPEPQDKPCDHSVEEKSAHSDDAAPHTLPFLKPREA